MILRYVAQIWILSLYVRSLSKSQVNPLHPKISMHILHTDHHTFSMLLTRRICLTIKRFFLVVIISFIPLTLMFDSTAISEGEIGF